ncbi:hypothetical protein L3Q82_024354 [Scortum barcoo]|uniref:Uncharacterized protein n=1 Tax=Scortum barcoo TaxID=214431 RepID=A0ACB8WVW1_9TELE|nr:hypothetical protein L3Q82_024354 [Scortum barcoo]
MGSGTQLLGLLLLFVGRTAVQSTQAFLESLGGVLDSALTGDSIVTRRLQRSCGQRQFRGRLGTLSQSGPCSPASIVDPAVRSCGPDARSLVPVV